MRALEITPKSEVGRLPGGGDGWYTQVTVMDGADVVDLNIGVADRAQGEPPFSWFADRAQRRAPDNFRSGVDQLLGRATEYPGLTKPVVWLSPENAHGDVIA
jgi:hypothetical protein